MRLGNGVRRAARDGGHKCCVKAPKLIRNVSLLGLLNEANLINYHHLYVSISIRL